MCYMNVICDPLTNTLTRDSPRTHLPSPLRVLMSAARCSFDQVRASLRWCVWVGVGGWVCGWGVQDAKSTVSHLKFASSGLQCRFREYNSTVG